ncbi:hypothetical protein ABZT02_45745 [Streptomyces sp. NPDC005402]
MPRDLGDDAPRRINNAEEQLNDSVDLLLNGSFLVGPRRPLKDAGH